MNVTVVFPYRGSDPHRVRAFEYTRRHMEALLPGARVIVADSGDEQFNRAASRNLGVRQADDGIVVVCDADTLVRKRPLLEAIEAAQDGRLHLPHTFFLSLTEEHTRRILDHGAGHRAGKPEFMVTTAVGGCLVIDRGAYLSTGGQDEGFHGWGGEDVAFKFACDALLGPTVRHPGLMFGLWHPSEMDQSSEGYKRNIARERLYRSARRDATRMKELIRRLSCE